MLKLAVQYELHHAFRELEAQGGAPDDLLGFRCRVTLGALHFVRLAERDHLRALADTHGIPEVLTLGLLDPA